VSESKKKLTGLVVSGQLGKSKLSEFYRPDDGRSDFMVDLIKKLKDEFELYLDSDKAPSFVDFELHVNVQFPRKKSAKRVLLLFEHESIRPQNLFVNSIGYHTVITYGARSDRLIKGQLQPIRYPHEPKISEDDNNVERKIKYSMVCSNRNLLFGDSNSLYNERQRVIEYIESEKRKDFELWGPDWNIISAKVGWFPRVIKLLKNTDRKERLNCWKGVADSKKNVLEQSVFNFCYENVRKFDGYVSEKLWDALAAGCVAVYFPACKDFASKIPDKTIINASDYKGPTELFNYLDSLSTTDIQEYLQNGKSLMEDSLHLISNEVFVSKVMEVLYDSNR
jgi:hypothetical protein